MHASPSAIPDATAPTARLPATACFPKTRSSCPCRASAPSPRLQRPVRSHSSPAHRELARGAGTETHDLLYDSPLAITAETVRAIRHCLVGPAPTRVEDIRVVHSHPVALDQCRQLLAGMPWATAIAAPTTADAAAQVAAHGDPTEVAIASERAAALHGLTLIADDVGDHPEAYTRFVAIATHMRLDANGERWRTAFSFVTDHQPGALHRAIEPFARHDIDLLQLVSRPIPQSPLALPLRCGARRPPARPDRERDSTRAAHVHETAPRLRVLSCERTMNDPRAHAPIHRLRDEISDLDRTILAAINARLALVAELKRYKEEHGISFVDPDRERRDSRRARRGERRAAVRVGPSGGLRELLDLMKREVSRDGAS